MNNKSQTYNLITAAICIYIFVKLVIYTIPKMRIVKVYLLILNYFVSITFRNIIYCIFEIFFAYHI